MSCSVTKKQKQVRPSNVLATADMAVKCIYDAGMLHMNSTKYIK